MFILHLLVPLLTLLNGSTLRILTIIVFYSMNVFGSPISQQDLPILTDYLAPATDINNNDDFVQGKETVIDHLPSLNEGEPIADYSIYYNMQPHNTIQNDYTSPTLSDNELNLLTSYLTQVLSESWRDNEIPLLYIEDIPPALPSLSTTIKEHQPSQQLQQQQSHQYHSHHLPNHLDLLNDDSFVENTAKRTRYYRKYPWKRQNSRARMYNAENKYMCQPSREDVYQLLLALHESRSGNRNRTVNFCNRRRPASAIYTNIRFLGRRRK